MTLEHIEHIEDCAAREIERLHCERVRIRAAAKARRQMRHDLAQRNLQTIGDGHYDETNA